MPLEALRAWTSRSFAAASLAAVALAVVLTSCGSPPPPAPLPNVYSTTASEKLPIDGLWKTGSDPVTYAQLERGRMYLQAGFGPAERHGTLLYADIHQSSANTYRCRRPVQVDGAIAWRRCKIEVEEGGWLRVRTQIEQDDPLPRKQRFAPVIPADELWFEAQADAWHIVSVREAHRPPPKAPVIGSAAVVPSLPPSPPPTEPALAVPSSAARFGRYRALVIGSADYDYLPAVATAEGDAAAVSTLLEEQYGFEVTHLRNPSLVDLGRALARYERELGANDNFLLYYAGHGYVSDEIGRCYWFPVEALGDDASQGFANEDVAAALRRMKAKHVMVVADSCFTAAQRREIGLQDESADVHERLSKLRTRVVLTSGGLEPLQDGQGSGHSVFTGAFLTALSANDEVLDGTSLFAQIQQIVTAGASQTPEYADIRGADHGGGDFLFVPTP